MSAPEANAVSQHNPEATAAAASSVGWRNCCSRERPLRPQSGRWDGLQRTTAMPNVRFLFHFVEWNRRRSVQVDARENLMTPMPYKLFTKSAQSSGPENIDYERPLPGLLAAGPVNSPSRITLENNGKIRPQPDRENAFAGPSGGGSGPDVQPSPLIGYGSGPGRGYSVH